MEKIELLHGRATPKIDRATLLHKKKVLMNEKNVLLHSGATPKTDGAALLHEKIVHMER